MTATAVGTRITQQGAPNGSNQSTMSITPTTLGNLFVLFTNQPSNTLNATSCSGGSCKALDGVTTNWDKCTIAVSSGTGRNFLNAFVGKATATAAANAVIQWSGAGGFPCTTGQEFGSSLGLGASTPWNIIDQDHIENAASATLTFPTSVATVSAQLYVGFASTDQAGTSTGAGSTTGGWVWQTDGYADQIVYNLSIGPGNVTAPNGTNSPAGSTSNALSIILSDVAPVVGSTSDFFFMMGHHDDELSNRRMKRRKSGLYEPDRQILCAA
jgi:hypothetical protein